MIRRIDRYITSSFIVSYLVALLFLVGLFMVTDGVSKVDDIVNSRAVLAREGVEVSFAPLVLRYFLIQIPLIFLTMGPFVSLFAGIFIALRLQRQNELAPILGAGRSLQRAMLPVLLGGLAAGGGMIVLREFFLGRIADDNDSIKAVILDHQRGYAIENLWFRDSADVFIGVRHFDPQAERIEGLTVSRRLPDGRVLNLRARALEWEPRRGERGRWRLASRAAADGVLEPDAEIVLESDSAGAAGAGVEAYRPPPWIGAHPEDEQSALWRVRFRPRDISSIMRLRTSPLELTGRQVRRLGRFYPEDHRLATLALYSYTFPAANLIVLLLGLPFCLCLERRGVIEGLAKGLLLCVVYFCVDFVLRDLGTRRVLAPAFACLAPLAAFGSLGAARFIAMRT